MDINQQLKPLHLSPRAKETYLATLKTHGGSVKDIAATSGLKESTTHKIVHDLKKEGLIKDKGHHTFLATDPKKLDALTGEHDQP